MHPGTYAATTPNKPAVIMADGRTLSYRELEETSNQLAHAFRSARLHRGDHIAFVLENRPEFFTLMWAAQRSGLYYTACSTRLKVDELEYIINDSGARMLVASQATAVVAAEVTCPRVERRLIYGEAMPGWESVGDVTEHCAVEAIDDQSEGVDMLYSSGTTGRPKGVKQPLPVTSYPTPLAGLERLFGFDEHTVFLSPAPLYHTAPLRFSMLAQRAGGSVVVEDHFDPEEFLALVERHRVTFAQLVPTMFIRLLRLDDRIRRRYDLSSLKGAVHAAAPCPIEVKEQMIDWWGPIIHEYYASTESNGFVYCDSADWLKHRGTVGRPILGPVHILDDHGEELAPHESGTIYFEGGTFEYHGDPTKTDGARDPKGRGWSTVGDIGYLDDDGFLFLTDRKAFMIISGGVNIYPQEAENILATHPAVGDVAVFGVPDDEMGERVHAVVQPAAGVTPSDALAAELIGFCRSRIAHFKCPRAIDFLEELPRHDTGKLYKGLLKEEYWQGRTLTR